LDPTDIIHELEGSSTFARVRHVSTFVHVESSQSLEGGCSQLRSERDNLRLLRPHNNPDETT